MFVWFLPQFTSLADVWTSVRAMTWAEIALLLAAALWNLATYQFVMVATMPGLTLRQATVSTQTHDGGLEHRPRRGGDLARASPTR